MCLNRNCRRSPESISLQIQDFKNPRFCRGFFCTFEFCRTLARITPVRVPHFKETGLTGRNAANSDDFFLMQAIAKGDRDALSLLYDRHAPLLLAICRRVLKDANEAEDVLTDVFFEVWSKADRFDSVRGSPVTYLVTLSRSRAIDRQRSRNSRPKITSDFTDAGALIDPVSNPSDSMYLRERQQQVRQALAGLDPAQREAVECAFYEGLSHSEIAQKLNRPLGTVKTYIRQGLIRLRESLRITQ